MIQQNLVWLTYHPPPHPSLSLFRLPPSLSVLLPCSLRLAFATVSFSVGARRPALCLF